MKKGLGIKRSYWCKAHRVRHRVRYHHSLKFKKCTEWRLSR